MHSAKGWWAFGLASAGVLWTAALVPGAFFVPAYSGDTVSSTGATTHTSDTLVGPSNSSPCPRRFWFSSRRP